MSDKNFKVGDTVLSDACGQGLIIGKYTCDSMDVWIVKLNQFHKKLGGIVEILPDGASACYPFSDEYEFRKSPFFNNEESTNDAVNPSHYNVEGVQQPIEVMQKLMTKEQYEGFLWGNIIEYAHRYGRKGDKKETAGKIACYAKWLEEVEE